MRENCGDINELEKIGKNKQFNFTTEQMLDGDLKNQGGENRKEVSRRMEDIINRIILENPQKRIAIVSHGAAIKFWLMKYCTLNKDNDLEYENGIIKVKSPGVIKIILKDKKVTEIKQIL